MKVETKFDIGEAVWIGPAGDRFEAQITKLCIEKLGLVSCHCSWWDGREPKEKWLYEFEITKRDG